MKHSIASNPGSLVHRFFRVLFAVGLSALLYVFLPPFFRPSQPMDVPVYTGTTAREIAHRLKERGVLTAQTPFRILCILTRADRHLKAGLYRLSPRMNLWSVLGILASGKSDLLTLKVPEGYTAAQIGIELQRLGVMDESAFLASVRDPALARSLGVTAAQLEGYLYPETYRVPLGASASDLVRLMVDQFKEVAGKDFDSAAQKQGLTPAKAVILASIVEKESGVDSERPVVAGVMYNRLRQKMRLEVNATVTYGQEHPKSWLTFKQIAVDSPYNTYQHRGLPPGPICNPGKSSLRAAVNPVASDYLYYVAKGDGTHLFASTFEGHQANVRKAKVERRRLKTTAAHGASAASGDDAGGWVGLDGKTPPTGKTSDR